MCVQYVPKPSLYLAVLISIERFTEENSQTLLLPRLMLQRPRIRNDEILMICLVFFVTIRYKQKLIHLSVTLL